MSQLFHLGERMGDHASLKADQDELISLSMIDGSDYQARSGYQGRSFDIYAWDHGKCLDL